MDDKQVSPQGLFFIADAISVEEEKSLIAFLNNQKWVPLTINVDTGRCVQQYGFRFDYHTYEIKDDVPKIPKELSGLIVKLTSICKQLKIDGSALEFSQIIVNRYLPGEGITAHIDWKAFGPIIGCFTLGASAPIEFTKEATKQSFILQTEPRSLYIMSGDSRTSWKHGMKSGNKDNGCRISVTIRHVLKT